MFRTIRLTFLLGVLAFVTLGAYLSRARTTDWDLPLWIAIVVLVAAASYRFVEQPFLGGRVAGIDPGRLHVHPDGI